MNTRYQNWLKVQEASVVQSAVEARLLLGILDDAVETGEDALADDPTIEPTLDVVRSMRARLEAAYAALAFGHRGEA